MIKQKENNNVLLHDRFFNRIFNYAKTNSICCLFFLFFFIAIYCGAASRLHNKHKTHI